MWVMIDKRQITRSAGERSGSAYRTVSAEELPANRVKPVTNKAAKKLFAQIREVIEAAEVKSSGWESRSLPESQWSIHADLKRFEVI